LNVEGRHVGRRNGRKKAQKTQKSELGVWIAEGVFFDLENGGAKIDEQSVFAAGGTEIAEELSDVFVDQGFHGFEFDDERIRDEKIGVVFTENRAVFIEDVERVLLHDFEALFAKAMGESVFVNFFVVAVTVIFLKGKGGFPHLIAKNEDRVF
jgi:hypothetical protein